MSDFHFLRPFWLLALPMLAVLVISLLRARGSSRTWAAVCDPQLLPFVLAGQQPAAHHSPGPWVFCIAATLLIIALAGPTWERIPQPVFRDESALVIALDLSRSMNAGDLKPSRLIRARHKITDILRLRESGQTALLVYAGEAFTVTPLTDDVATILAQLSSLDSSLMPSQGSRSDRAVDAAAALLRQAGVARADVLLVTDGIESRLLASPLDSLRKQGHRLSILAAGTEEGAPVPLPEGGFLKDSDGAIVVPKLDATVLQAWAQRGGGRYAAIRADDRDIQYLFAGQGGDGPKRTEQAADQRSEQWRDQGPWLILLAVPLAALAFRRGVLVLLLAMVIPLPRPAGALDWASLWSRPDQRGVRALEEGAAADAAQRFEDPRWKAVAQYRAGQYDRAAATLAPMKTPEALYNRGNALARLGRYPQAISSYQQVLELDPDHADARYNLELLQQKQQEDRRKDRHQRSQQNSSASQQQGAEAGEDQDSNNDAVAGERSQGDEGDFSRAEEEMQAAEQQRAQSAGRDADDESAQARAEESEVHTPASQQAQSSEGEAGDDVKGASLNEHQSEDESGAAMEQWLRRIPDDPGGLLRRKFLYQYQQRERRAKPEELPW